MAGTNSTARDQLNSLIAEQKALNKEKSALTAQMRAFKESIEGAQKRSQTLKSMLLKGYDTLEDIEDALSGKKHQQATSTMSAAEESKIIKEIKKL